MRLNLYDKNLKRIAIIGEQFVSCLWAEGYNTVQNFTLELQATAEYKKKVLTDYYVGRDDRRTLMVIKTVQAAGGKIVASGKQATRRLDDAAFVGTIKAGSDVASSIKAAYDGGSKVTQMEFAESDLQIAYPSQISNKSILELSTTMCQSTDVGFRAVRGQGQINVEFYQPELNPNLVFSQQFGNLDLQSVTLSTENLKNYAIVLGQGDGDSRIRVDVDETGGGERLELIVDARDLQQGENETESEYRERLAARGHEKLLEKQKTWQCAFAPLGKDFGVRYDLGDILTVPLPDYGMKLQARVAKFTQKAQMNKTTTTIEVGTITILR